MQSFFSKFIALFASVILWFSSLFGIGAKGQDTVLRLLYPNYAGARTQLAGLPGLADGFTPQGVTYLPEKDVYLLCGYMDDGTASRLYVLRNGGFTELTLQKQNGAVFTGHAGGLTAAGNYVYVSNNQHLYILNKSDVLSANAGDALSFIGSIAVPCRASFCASDAQRVYVGEYHRDKGYETDSSHELTAPDGTVYKALVFGYTISPESPFGLLSDAPAVAFSTCDNVQGFTLTPDGTAVLSCSAGSADSKLLFYDCSGKQDGVFPLGDAQIPLYYLTDGRMRAAVTLPRMSEDVEYDNGDIVLVFESGATKYWYARPFAEKNIVRLSVDALLK